MLPGPGPGDDGSMTQPRPAVVLAVTMALAALAAGCSRAAPAASATPGRTTVCHDQAVPVSGGAYRVASNEWASAATECVATSGNADFTVVRSAIDNLHKSAPGGYPFIYRGCHWGVCTTGSGLPVQASGIRPGTVITSWSTTQPGGPSRYNAAYDIWFSQSPATSGQPDGAELMIWLAVHGPTHPGGRVVAGDLAAGGYHYTVWLIRRRSWNAITYVMTSPVTSVSHLDLQPLVADAERRGAIAPAWYLISVEAGFEIWRGGAGLATRSFSVTVTRDGG
jgi:Glycosyl hydrolase family 12